MYFNYTLWLNWKRLLEVLTAYVQLSEESQENWRCYKMDDCGADNIWPLIWALKDAWKMDIICIGKEEGRLRTKWCTGKTLYIVNKLVFLFREGMEKVKFQRLLK